MKNIFFIKSLLILPALLFVGYVSLIIIGCLANCCGAGDTFYCGFYCKFSIGLIIALILSMNFIKLRK